LNDFDTYFVATLTYKSHLNYGLFRCLRTFGLGPACVRSLAILLAAVLFAGTAVAQTEPAVRTQEFDEKDGVPVILKHLPNWEAVRGSSVFIASKEELSRAVGDRPVNSAIEFVGGTEAASAVYPEGRLLIVEYTTPQFASAADVEFLRILTQTPTEPPTVYRRVGNYAVFVFDTPDAEAAAGLIDQVKYEKDIQWLGESPFLLQNLERYFVTTSRDIIFSIILWIFMGFAVAVLLGGITGYSYFKYREGVREKMVAFSDAGGLTRLNLDDLSEPIRPD
jgi:hypothetical protein